MKGAMRGLTIRIIAESNLESQLEKLLKREVNFKFGLHGANKIAKEKFKIIK